jgi:putative transposase
VAGGRWGDGQGAHGGDLIGPNPTDRGKRGVKRSLHVEGQGGPLGVVIAGANRPDLQLLAQTLDAIVVERPKVTARHPQHLCLDRGYDYTEGWAVVVERGYEPHIKLRGVTEVVPDEGRWPARRWVVERTLAWLSKCRAILIRWDSKAANYLALLQYACALLWYRRLYRLTVLR